MKRPNWTVFERTSRGGGSTCCSCVPARRLVIRHTDSTTGMPRLEPCECSCHAEDTHDEKEIRAAPAGEREARPSASRRETHAGAALSFPPTPDEFAEWLFSMAPLSAAEARKLARELHELIKRRMSVGAAGLFLGRSFDEWIYLEGNLLEIVPPAAQGSLRSALINVVQQIDKGRQRVNVERLLTSAAMMSGGVNAQTIRDALIAQGFGAFIPEPDRQPDVLRDFVPQTYGDAIASGWIKHGACAPHEWDNRTSAENAKWMLERSDLRPGWKRFAAPSDEGMGAPYSYHQGKSGDRYVVDSKDSQFYVNGIPHVMQARAIVDELNRLAKIALAGAQPSVEVRQLLADARHVLDIVNETSLLEAIKKQGVDAYCAPAKVQP